MIPAFHVGYKMISVRCNMDDKKKRPQELILKPQVLKMVCGFPWSPLFTEVKLSGHPARPNR